MKKVVLSLVGLFTIFAFTPDKKLSFSGQAPAGSSGVNGFSCNACHNSFALNSGGGSVVVTGLPTSGYIANQIYPLSITITHGVADRQRWGFALKAVNSADAAVGKFTSGSGTTIISDIGSNDFSEIAHSGAVITVLSSSYTYTGFSWQAPAAPSGADLNVRFFAAGNAANNNGGSSGDYIYNTVYANITLPIVLVNFNATLNDNRQIRVQWETTTETNSDYFAIERSYQGSAFAQIGKQVAKGNASLASLYTFTDANPPQFYNSFQYRLKMVDKDGRYVYSTIKTVQVAVNKTTVKAISPNPAVAGIPLLVELLAHKRENLTINIYAIDGKLVNTQSALVEMGNNKILLNATTLLKAGTYTVVVKGNDVDEKTIVIIQ